MLGGKRFCRWSVISEVCGNSDWRCMSAMAMFREHPT